MPSICFIDFHHSNFYCNLSHIKECKLSFQSVHCLFEYLITTYDKTISNINNQLLKEL